MFLNNGDELKQILYNIELQIHDLELEKEGHFIKLYFDTSDVEESITGISRFYDYKKHFHEELFFNNEKTLVHGLATSGDLGEVHLLPPHKGELFNRLKYLKDIPQTDKDVNKFLNDTNFDKYKWKSVYKDKNKVDSRIINDIIDKIKPDDAENFFKTVQNLSPWYDRMKESIDENRLIIHSIKSSNENNISYEVVLNEDSFTELKEIFNHLRQDQLKTINNATDAFCLAMLIEKIKLFSNNKNKSKLEVPRFFASSKVLKHFLGSHKLRAPKAIKNLIEKNRERLIYSRTPQDIPISVMRDERYFILRAILNKEDFSTKEKRITDSLKKLKDWKKQVESFIEAKSKVETSDEITKTWVKEFTNRRKVFFSEIWLNSNAPRQLYQAAVNVVKAYEEIKNSSELEARISKLVSETENKISQEVDDARMLISLDNILEERQKKTANNIDILRNQFNLDHDEVLTQQFSNYFPFQRYSFESIELKEITESIKGVLERNTTLKKVLLSNYAQLINDAPRRNDIAWTKKLTKVSIILKTIKSYKVLIHLLNKINPNFPSFSFNILFAELLLRDNKHRRANKILEELKHIYFNEKESKTVNKKLQNDLAVGIALLYYWWWEEKGGKSLWITNRIIEDEIEKQRSDNEIKKQEELEPHLQEAIIFAEEAYSIWRESGQAEREELYALNLVLYFKARSNRRPEEDKLDSYANRLANYIDNEKWSYRYSDSLALYNAKKAVYSKDKRKSESFIRLANGHIERAKMNAGIDKTIIENAERIRLVESNLLGKNSTSEKNEE